ncbi:hypothetical protein L1987_56958 [Smallanthus sonchifolius]|uniref:Uncharacterized protein n=1 Tax=Smallanthus sonchifolius TaxID=185202 RepID=A0ACB9DC88_9ASTR|nr:hypothetical protein L1987_56958 [Smallanthus sonchifolius]
MMRGHKGFLNSIPKGTTEVVFRGNFNKVAYYLALALCHKGIKVAISRSDDYQKLKLELDSTHGQDNMTLSRTYSQKVWLVGDGLSKEEELKASKGTLIIPYSRFPPNKVNKYCFYQTTPAMLTPKHLENVDSCENWLPRRVLSAWRIAGILHGLEGWNVNECGNEMFNVENIWQARKESRHLSSISSSCFREFINGYHSWISNRLAMETTWKLQGTTLHCTPASSLFVAFI